MIRVWSSVEWFVPGKASWWDRSHNTAFDVANPGSFAAGATRRRKTTTIIDWLMRQQRRASALLKITYQQAIKLYIYLYSDTRTLIASAHIQPTHLNTTPAITRHLPVILTWPLSFSNVAPSWVFDDTWEEEKRVSICRRWLLISTKIQFNSNVALSLCIYARF